MYPSEGIREPTIEDNWRGIILYGLNVQSYKFALAKSLLGLKPSAGDLIKLEDLAPVYAKHLAEHLKKTDKQGTAPGSKFLDACRGFNSGSISEDKLVGATLKMGFTNVVDAFHRVNREDVPTRFFLDERKINRGLRVTENFSQLG